MNKLILLLITSFIFSQQLQVDGNLKVTGDISWQNGAMAKLNELSQEGWKVNSRLTSGTTIGYDSFYIYELMRKVEEQD